MTRFRSVASRALVLLGLAAGLTLASPTASPAGASSAGCADSSVACQNLGTLPCADSVPEREAGIFIEAGETAAFGPVWRTTTKCRDIQIRSRSSYGLRASVCFVRTGACNGETAVSPNGPWTVIATDVCDFTDFRVRIRVGDRVSGRSFPIWSDH